MVAFAKGYNQVSTQRQEFIEEWTPVFQGKITKDSMLSEEQQNLAAKALATYCWDISEISGDMSPVQKILAEKRILSVCIKELIKHMKPALLPKNMQEEESSINERLLINIFITPACNIINEWHREQTGGQDKYPPPEFSLQ